MDIHSQLDERELPAGRANVIRTQVSQIRRSPAFMQAPRMCQFLDALVDNSLAGGPPLKETAVGVRVFNRGQGYDSAIDPIVRVEARRLRQKLDQYYSRWGAADAVVIRLPKGGYSVEFEFRTAPPVPAGPPPAPRSRPVWFLAGAAVLACVALALLIQKRPLGAASTGAAAPHTITSIAVLPLANLSGDPGQDYIADGITDELIGSLARLSALRVISRTSVVQYKNGRKPVRMIARELGTDAVVEGSITRSGQDVRITAQLIDAKADRHLWSHDYQRRIGDMLRMESEVAQEIANAIRQNLSLRDEGPPPRQVELSAEAGEAYLKGRYFWNRRTEADLRKAIDYYQETVAKAPGYAPAWAGLADCWLLLGETWVHPKDPAFAQAQKAVDKALALDDRLGEAHAVRAALENDRGQWQLAEAEFRRALDLAPGYATAHQWYAEGLAAHGRMDEALAEIGRARQLDPLSLTVNVQVGYVLFLARRYDDAIAQLRSAVEMDPYFWMAHAVLGHAYEMKRRYADAIRELQRAVDLSNRSPGQMLWLAEAEALGGQQPAAQRARADLEHAFAQGQVSAAPMAVLDLALGESGRAAARIRSACESQTPPSVGPSPILDPLRSDPRIRAELASCPAVAP